MQELPADDAVRILIIDENGVRAAILEESLTEAGHAM